MSPFKWLLCFMLVYSFLIGLSATGLYLSTTGENN